MHWKCILGEFGFSDDFIFDCWGAIQDAKAGRVPASQSAAAAAAAAAVGSDTQPFGMHAHFEELGHF